MFCPPIPEPPVDVPGVDEVHPDILETLRHLHIFGAVDEGAAGKTQQIIGLERAESEYILLSLQALNKRF